MLHTVVSTTSQADRSDRSELVNLKLSKQDNKGVGESVLFATSCEIFLSVCIDREVEQQGL